MSQERLLELAEIARSALSEMSKIRSENKTKYSYYQSKENNLRHELEMLKLNPFQSYKVIKHYQELIRNRRTHKSIADIAEQFLTDIKYPNTIDVLTKASEAMKENVKRHENLIFDSGLIKKILAAEEVAAAAEEEVRI